MRVRIAIFILLRNYIIISSSYVFVDVAVVVIIIIIYLSSILKFIRPSPNSFYGGQNIMGIKLVTRLRLGLSHLREHKFKHSFQDTLNPLCNCGMDVESSTHFLLQCPSCINERCTLMSNLNRINPQISQTFLQLLTNTLLFGNSSYSDRTNARIVNATIDYI